MNASAEGYLALAVSILGKCPPEQAFSRLEHGFKPGSGGHNRSTLNELDTFDMALFRERGMTWTEIGEIFGIRPSAACRKVTLRHQKRAS